MNLNQRIETFSELGDYIQTLDRRQLNPITTAANNQNAWFSGQSVQTALKSLVEILNRDNLEKWAEKYNIETSRSKQVGIIMAGNIPLVGFHDLLCALISGHVAQVKLSSQDSSLFSFIIDRLGRIQPEMSGNIKVVSEIPSIDAVIATGSDNTSRYFEYNFRDIPALIRKNRTSCAVLTGSETEQQLTSLGDDIFLYFGLGCRNVSKIYVPAGYDFNPLIDCMEGFREVVHHRKYVNNYNYQKAIYRVTAQYHLDTGFVLIKPEEELVAPIAVVFSQEYENQKDLKSKLKSDWNRIQCIVASQGLVEGSVAFGRAQFPHLWDYADGMDTMKFLQEL